MPHQEALSVVAPVNPRSVAPLQAVLARIQDDPARNSCVPFAALSGCHFGRLLFLPGGLDLQGESLEPKLLLLSDCDGPANDHLEQLVEAAGPGLDQLFGHCQGYPRRPSSHGERLQYLKKQRVPTRANYVRRPGRSVTQIKQEDRLRRALQDFVQSQDFGGSSALDARARILRHVESAPDLRWALEPAPGLDFAQRARRAIELALVGIGLGVFAPWLVPSLLALLALVRLQESTDPAEHVRPSPEHLRALAELEDFHAQNGFSVGGFAKPGWVRQTVLAGVLPLLDFGMRQLCTHDSLAGVRTIHSARWLPLDGGRRMLFASNYDGSLEDYSDALIDLLAWGVNLVFSNVYGYPRTRWLLFGGASREQEFKDYLRRHQIPTPVWYSAYPHLTAANIVRNAALRAGLSVEPNEREAQAWLRLL